MVKRKEVNGGFLTREELENFLAGEQDDVQLIRDDSFVEFGFS